MSSDIADGTEQKVTDKDRDKLRREITEFIQSEFGAPTNIDSDTPLIAQGIVDSSGRASWFDSWKTDSMSTSKLKTWSFRISVRSTRWPIW